MRKMYFLICCILTFAFIWSEVLGAESVKGIMNPVLNPMHYGNHYFHNGYDFHWDFVESPATSDRPYLPAYNGGALLLKYAAFTIDNAGVDLCINPAATAPVVTDPKEWFGVAHCDLNLVPEITLTVLTTIGGGQINHLVAKPGSKLAGLCDKVRDAYIYIYGNENPAIPLDQYNYCKPSGITEEWPDEYMIPGIAAGDKIAVMGNYGGATGPKKNKHFHVNLFCQNNGGEIYNIAHMHLLKDYIKTVLTNLPNPTIKIGDFFLRENYRDCVCTGRPTEVFADLTARDFKDIYLRLTESSPTPTIGFPLPEKRAGVYRDIDIIINAFIEENYKYVHFENIVLKINRLYPETTSENGVETCKPTSTNMVDETIFALPQSLSVQDASFGATAPPKAIATSIYDIAGANGNYGYIYEYFRTDGSYPMATLTINYQATELPANKEPDTWLNNPDTNEGDSSNSKIVKACWILSNLHNKYGPNGEFRFDPRNRYLCWNSNVHCQYTPNSQLNWWLPPQISGRSYPPLPNGVSAPSHAPDFINNLAYHPDFAAFPDGRYDIEAEFDPVRGDATSKKSEVIFVNNFKPYLKYISVHQQQIDWNTSETAWKDPDVSEDWLSLEAATSNTLEFGGSTKELKHEFCVYAALWERTGGNSVESPNANLALRTVQTSSEGNSASMESGDLCSFESNSISRAKKWIHGRKALLFELEFSEPIDKDTFYLDLEDRWGEFRQMLSPTDFVAAPDSTTSESSIFDYFDFDNCAEKGFTFKKGSNNTIIIAKLPALGMFMKFNSEANDWQTGAIFDAAERRISIYCCDEAGTPVACLDNKQENCEAICRNTEGDFSEDEGDCWLHRLYIDTVTEAKCQITPKGIHNWPMVEEQINELEANNDFMNILNWHYRDYVSSSCTVWTTQYDPKRSVFRESIDGNLVLDSSGTRQTRVQVGEYKIDDRDNDSQTRIMDGRTLTFCPGATFVSIECFTVDFAGNKDAAIGLVVGVPVQWARIQSSPPVSNFTTAIPTTWATAPPVTTGRTAYPESLYSPSPSNSPTQTENPDPEFGTDIPETFTPPPSPSPSLTIESIGTGNSNGSGSGGFTD